MNLIQQGAHTLLDVRSKLVYGMWSQGLSHSPSHQFMTWGIQRDEMGGAEQSSASGSSRGKVGRVGQEPQDLIVAKKMPDRGRFVIADRLRFPHLLELSKDIRELVRE